MLCSVHCEAGQSCWHEATEHGGAMSASSCISAEKLLLIVALAVAQCYCYAENEAHLSIVDMAQGPFAKAGGSFATSSTPTTSRL